MIPLALSLQKAAAHLVPHQEALVESWLRLLTEGAEPPQDDVRGYCARGVSTLLGRLSRGEVDELLRDEAAEAAQAAATGSGVRSALAAVRSLDRCCIDLLLARCAERGPLAESVLALHELGARRLEILVRAQEEESARRLVEAQEHGARAAERARDLARANEGLRRSEAESQERAEQIGLLGLVVHRIAGVLDPERLMQEAADTIQARMNHTYVAVVVLDDEGVLVGRWAGRPGVGRRSAGRTQGPAGGVIGRALRKRAPQVVPEVTADPDYHADVAGTSSEMAIPLLENGDVVGALDYQSERPAAFGLDDVAVAETLAEFLVVALRNARLVAELRRSRSA